MLWIHSSSFSFGLSHPDKCIAAGHTQRLCVISCTLSVHLLRGSRNRGHLDLLQSANQSRQLQEAEDHDIVDLHLFLR